MENIIFYKEPQINTIIERTKIIFEKQWQEDLKLIEKFKKKEKTYDNYYIYLSNSKEMIELNQELTHLFHLNNVATSDKIEKIIQELIIIFSEYELKYNLDIRFYNALKEVEEHLLKNKENIENFKHKLIYIQKSIKSEKLTGIELSNEKKEELSKINEEISLLSNQFNINDILSLQKENKDKIVSYQDLKDCGFSDDNIERFKNNNEYKINTLNDYIEFMKYSPNREKRKKLHKLFSSRAEENKEIIDKILNLRTKIPKIIYNDNSKNYSDLILEERDAKDVDTVFNFLNDLTSTKIRNKANNELEDLKNMAKKDGINDFKNYDFAYYSKKVEESLFNIDENYLKQFFESRKTLNGILNFIEESFDVKFKEIDLNNKYETWNKDVLLFELYSKSNQKIGIIYFDLYERENKSSGAWKSSIENYHKDNKNNIILPSCNVVCNFQKKDKNGISLLTHRDVITIFHELGHALHHLFSKVEINNLSGTNVLWDVVEFPSQFLELFASDENVLNKINEHYKTKEKLSNKDIQNIIKSKDFLIAYQTLRQVEFSLIDMELHSTNNPNVEDIIKNVRKKTSVIKNEDYEKQIYTFSHIFAGGYSASYYSYKWAEILSIGVFKFYQNQKNDIDKLKVLKNFKELILETGGTVDIVEQFIKITGNKPQIDNLI
jgi:oligopeptidase A